jgi:hypothetical protein
VLKVNALSAACFQAAAKKYVRGAALRTLEVSKSVQLRKACVGLVELALTYDKVVHKVIEFQQPDFQHVQLAVEHEGVN